jgi:ABC-type branched-subunit amino acid transport system ATPase component
VSADGDPLLAIEGLVKSFGGVHAVDGVSLTVPRGSLMGMIGPNGAGKSTVLSMIAGSVRPDRGSIRLDGEDIAGLRPYQAARRGVIRTFQSASVFPRMTVLENVLLGVSPWNGEGILHALARRRKWRREERRQVDEGIEILNRLGLADHADAFAGELSGGQKRLVEIGRAITARPRLLLLDEPLAGVSRTLAPAIEMLIGELRDEGMTVVLVEHELGLVERLCSPVVVLAHGRVLMQGEMDEARVDPEVRKAYLVG